MYNFQMCCFLKCLPSKAQVLYLMTLFIEQLSKHFQGGCVKFSDVPELFNCWCNDEVSNHMAIPRYIWYTPGQHSKPHRDCCDWCGSLLDTGMLDSLLDSGPPEIPAVKVFTMIEILVKCDWCTSGWWWMMLQIHII